MPERKTQTEFVFFFFLRDAVYTAILPDDMSQTEGQNLEVFEAGDHSIAHVGMIYWHERAVMDIGTPESIHFPTLWLSGVQIFPNQSIGYGHLNRF